MVVGLPGNVFIPHPHVAGWVNGFIDECVSFPSAKHDDQVDAMSQALNYLASATDAPPIISGVFKRSRSAILGFDVNDY